ncbi:MAG: adenosylcobinamide-GDP ribazoletransferase [Paraprevotella sp.]|nr:adenosylcobinamide-GDP ribazoletransferase [Paraprevotella sp.]
MFFTRLPFWRIKRVDSECFKHVVDYRPVAGLLTGGTAAVVFWCTSGQFPPMAAALMAVGARLLLTGALHKDGLADFCDGFGGGTTRERTLSIMKDSHIGTYGVLGLIFHTGLLVGLIFSLPPACAPAILFTADIYAKACSSFIILQLPYARTAEQAKSGVVYSVWTLRAACVHFGRCLAALAPGVVWLYCISAPFPYWAFLFPPVVELLLTGWMRRRLQGYTGDCCGALFLWCELSFYGAVVMFYT